MLNQKLNIDAQEICVFLPENASGAMGVFYVFADNEHEAVQLAKILPEQVALIAILNTDWARDLTPWPAPCLFKKGADFAGGAARYHADLIEKQIPQIERMCGIQAAWRGILGYSLAGLFAVYGAMVSPYFDYVASVSGSLWFDDFVDFVQKNRPPTLPRAIYFSLGDAESNSKNPRTAQVQAATERIVATWQTWPCPSFFEMNAGGHFDDVPQRLAKAAKWLLQAT